MNISLHWAIAWVLFGVGQFPSMTHGQDPILDSLLEIRTHVETDEELLKSLLQIGSRLGWSDQERAESYVDSAIALATDLRDLSQLGYALLQKYDLEVHTGKKVLVSLDEIQSLFDQTGDQLGVAKVYSQRAFTAETAGDFVEAMRFQTQSRQIYLELGAELELHNANVDLAGLLQSLDNHEEALAYLDQSEDYIHRNGSTENIAYFHLIKADALKRLERYDEALEENKFLREYALKHGYMADVITSGTCIGDIYMDRGDLASAEEWYEQAWADARIYEHPYHLAYVRSGLGELAIKRGEYEEAIEHFESMLTVMNSPDSRYFMNSNWRLMAKAYRGVGNMEEAYNSLLYYSETQDSIHLREARQIAVQTEAVYQTKLAQEQIERGERERTFAYGIAGLLALFGIGLFVGFVQKQKSNRKLKDLIEQREFLVKEIHHRVKNNLQIISSLLNLQADEIEDVSAALAVAEGRNRVQSMSLIHQQLYLGEHMMDIDMRIYLDDLTEHLVDSLGFPGQGIETEIDVQVPPLDVDTAIPIGLIVNELVTNSMKYAFAKDENGKIFIELFLENPNNLILRLKDNGRSSVDSQVHSQGTKFGSGLVDILSKKLKGKVDRNHRESGYETEIRFRRFRLGSSVAEA